MLIETQQIHADVPYIGKFRRMFKDFLCINNKETKFTRVSLTLTKKHQVHAGSLYIDNI